MAFTKIPQDPAAIQRLGDEHRSISERVWQVMKELKGTSYKPFSILDDLDDLDDRYLEVGAFQDFGYPQTSIDGGHSTKTITKTVQRRGQGWRSGEMSRENPETVIAEMRCFSNYFQRLYNR